MQQHPRSFLAYAPPHARTGGVTFEVTFKLPKPQNRGNRASRKTSTNGKRKPAIHKTDQSHKEHQDRQRRTRLTQDDIWGNPTQP